MHLRHWFPESESIHNMRDIGGYMAKATHITRYGVVLRSGQPVGASEEEIAYLLENGLTDCIDLRKESERELYPNSLTGKVHIHTYDALPQTSVVMATTAEEHDVAASNMGNAYIEMLDQRGAIYVQALEVIANAQGMTLVHCYAGKDRTGVLVALLLSAVGVGYLDIVADYQVSHTYLLPSLERHMRMFPDIPPHVFSSDPVHMQRALEHLDTAYGGPLAYLQAQGMTPALRERLCDKLLDEM